MITLKEYQEEAVKGLLKNTYSLLQRPGARHKMVFKAPTGAGKTVSMAAFLDRLCNELPDKLEIPQRKVAFIWFAPNQLHLQSYEALKDYFKELRSIRPIQFEDVTDGGLKPNEMLFVNWQSVNKNNNLYIKENEQGKDLVKYVYNAMLNDIEIICILDEAHYFARGKKSQELLQQIHAKVEVDVSATPEYRSDYTTVIHRHEVIQEEMIKENVVLNPALDHSVQEGRTLNQVLMDEALKKRKELAEAYQKLGVNINPLLLIQLPNDNKKESALDREVIKEVEEYLTYRGLTVNNGRLAVWLSDRKDNLEEIEKTKSMVDVLLFKQAIALGWDCPRAAVLLIFREIKSPTFGIQTVGRILRMPEQKHYTNPLLNNGYVYTNLSTDVVQIVKEDADYIVQNKAIRIEDYKPVALDSIFVNTRLTRNRLSSKFRKCLYEVAEENWEVTYDLSKTEGESIEEFNRKKLEARMIYMDVSNIDIPIPKDLQIAVAEGATRVTEKESFAKTIEELNTMFRQFCRDHVGGYAKVDSTPVLEMALKLFFEQYLLINEYDAVKVILYPDNQPRFIELIDKALEKHEELLRQKAAKLSKRIENSKWDVPSERIYNEQYQKRTSKEHALQPFYEGLRVSKPEREFVAFLEKHQDSIEWWYKNGDKNKEDFAVSYEDVNGVTRGFYVDFVIQLKDGTLALFDTKTPDSDLNFVQKHNALYEYIQNKSTPEKPLIGGVIVPRSNSDYTGWRYAENLIDRANDKTGWTFFNPSDYTE